MSNNSNSVSDRDECMAAGCEEPPVEIHKPIDRYGSEWGEHAFCEKHSRQADNKIRDIDAGTHREGSE